jgi:hypothetical protein
MQNSQSCGQNEHSARTITGPVPVCNPPLSLFVTPPEPNQNQTVPIYPHFTSTACAKPVRLLTVNVVVPGSGG